MSDKVAVVAKIAVKPESASEAESILRGLVDAAAQEPGTLEYVLSREGESVFWFHELYADQSAFEAHGKNPALAAAFGPLGPLLAEAPALHIVTPLQASHLDV